MKSNRREGMERARAAPCLTVSELDAILVRRRDTIDSSDDGDVDFETDRRSAGVGYRVQTRSSKLFG